LSGETDTFYHSLYVNENQSWGKRVKFNTEIKSTHKGMQRYPRVLIQD